MFLFQKLKWTSFFLVFLFVVSTPFAVFGQSSDQQAKLQALMAQIKELQAKLVVLQQQQAVTQPVAPQSCVAFTRNLRIGDSGDDVNKLVKVLLKSGVLTPQEIDASQGDYDERVAAGVSEFQEKMMADVLKKAGLRRGSGYVGPSTRARLNRLYGCATNVVKQIQIDPVLPVVVPPPLPPAPVVPLVQSNTTIPAGKPLACGEKGDLDGNGIINQADYEFEGQAVAGNKATTIVRGDINGDGVLSIADWVALGRYTSGLDTAFTGCKTNSPQPAVTVLSPNGGEKWTAGSTYTIKWSGPMQQINLFPVNVDGTPDKSRSDVAIVSSSPTSVSFDTSGLYTWTIPATIATGLYQIHVGSQVGGDVSDQSFIIDASTPVNNSTLSAERLFVGQYDNTRYSLTLTDPDGISDFALNKASGDFAWGGSPKGGTPPCPVSIRTGTVTYLPTDFPLVGTINDCKNPTVKYSVRLAMPASPVVTVPVGKPLACGVLGDVNRDGVINSTDYDLEGQAVAGTFTGSSLSVTDIDGNGVVSIADWVALGRYVSGLDTTFTGCPKAVSVGSLLVSLDSSAPSGKTVSGGSTGVIASVWKMRANDEAVNVNEIAIKFEGSNQSAVTSYSIFDGGTQVGSGFFTPNSRISTTTLTQSIYVPKFTDKSFILKINVSPVGLGFPAQSGDTISFSVSGVRGVGVDSAQIVPVVLSGWISSYVITLANAVAMIEQVPLPTTSLVMGRNVLYRYKITSQGGNLTVGPQSFTVAPQGVSLSGLELDGYTDMGFSRALITFPTPTIATVSQTITTAKPVQFTPTQNVVIIDGQTYYFDVVANVANVTGGSVTVATLFDRQPNAFLGGIFPTAPVGKPLACYKLGDLNSDGVINSTDYDLEGQVAAGIDTTRALSVTDINGSGTVTISDWVALGRYVNGLDTMLEGCKMYPFAN